MQFKLVKKSTLRVQNTISFVNLPTSRQSDVNMAMLSEIINKQTLKKAKDFMPYNKSILTRILFDQLKKQNTLVITHYPRKAILKSLKAAQGVNAFAGGPARGLFNSLVRLGFSEHL